MRAFLLLVLLTMLLAAPGSGKADGPAGTPFRIAFSDDGTVFAAGYDDIVALYHVNGTCVWERPFSNLRDIAISASGGLVAAAGPGIELLNRTGDPVWEFQNGYFVYAVSLSGNGTALVAGVDDETLKYFDLSGGGSWSLAFPDDIMSVAITADGRYIAAGTEEGGLYLFRSDGEELWHYQFPGSEVAHIALSGDASTIAASSAHEMLHVFNRNGKALWSCAYPGISSLSVSHEGTLIAAGGDRFSLFDRNGQLIRSYDLEPHASFLLSKNASVLVIYDARGLMLLPMDESQDMAIEPDRNESKPFPVFTSVPGSPSVETSAVEGGSLLTALLTGIAVLFTGWLLFSRKG